MRAEPSGMMHRIAREITRRIVDGSRQPGRPDKMVAVVVPLRDDKPLDAAERLAIRQLRKHLGTHERFVLLPRGARNPLPDFVPVRFPRRFFGSAARHAALLGWRKFHLRFADYRFILFHHTDSLVFSDQLHHWCSKQIDYIGAPWLPCSDSPWVTRARVGNGGLALLRTEAAIRAIDARHRCNPRSWWLDGFVRNCPSWVARALHLLPGKAAASLLTEWQAAHDPAPSNRNNDIFWSDLAPYYDPHFRVASLAEGLAFAFEVDPAGCFIRNGHRMPFGCHAWRKYGRHFWEERLRLEEHHPDTPSKAPPADLALPNPPKGCRGWPWTGKIPPLRPVRDGSPWPRISLVVPCLNHAAYLEQALRSALMQGYPDLELIVIDGGSTDHTHAVVERYLPWIAHFVSEKDEGQSDAINRGFSMATGTVFNWLCADDLLCEGALESVGRAFLDPAVDVVSGACRHVFETDSSRSVLHPPAGDGWKKTPWAGGIWQPSTFWRIRSLGRGNPVRTELEVCMDRELWCHLVSSDANWVWTEECLSVYRFTGDNKSTSNAVRTIREIAMIHSRYSRQAGEADPWLLNLWLPLVEAARNTSSPVARTALRVAGKSVSTSLLAAFPAREIRSLQREFDSYAKWG